MKPHTTIATRSRPNRMLVILAAGWMILSLAIGGAVSAETRGDTPSTTAITSVQE